MKQLLANLNWTFVKAWWKRRDGWEWISLAFWTVVGSCFLILVISWLLSSAKAPPKELTPLDLSVILTEKVNKLNSQIRAAEKRIETLERQLAGELPQIHGGVSYDTRRTSK